MRDSTPNLRSRGEIYPHRYTDNPKGEWQVKVFAGDGPDGDFLASLELGEGALQPAIAQPGTHSAPSHFTGSSAATAFARRSSAVTSCDFECTARAM